MLKMEDTDSFNSENLISQVGRISKYLYSYDYFLKIYQKLLGLRILYDNFKNQQAEYALITLFKVTHFSCRVKQVSILLLS